MEVRAIVVLGCGEEPSGRISGLPFGMLEVLGKRMITRVIERLRRGGIDTIHVVAESCALSPAAQRSCPGVKWIETAGSELWRQAAHVFAQSTQSADAVVLVRVGAWLDIDYEHLVQTHLSRGGRVTAVTSPSGDALGVAVVSGGRRNDAAHLLKAELLQVPVNAVRYAFHGYSNELRSAYDLRKLAVDGLIGRADVAPVGTEIKPGVWVADGARIQRGARVLAPCYIGPRVKVRSSAVVTRGSSIERGAWIDCGAVIDNTTVLAHTTVGAGLDLSHSVAGYQRVANLARGVEVPIADSKLIGLTAAAPVRAVKSAASLASFVPMQFLRGLFSRNGKHEPATVAEAVKPPAAALNARIEADGDFPAQLLVARRYGNE